MKRTALALIVFAGASLAVSREAEFAHTDFSEELKFMSADPDSQTSRLAGLLGRGMGSYESLRDYTAIFRKRESSGGKAGPWERIYFKFEKPFKVFMGWLNTRKKGLQVFYERDRFDNKLAIHKPGLLFGLAPVVFLDQKSPWVREGSASYDIEDAGIGAFLFDFTRAVLEAWREKRLRVVFANPENTHKADVTFEVPGEDEVYFAKRIVVGFDEKTNLPVTMLLYDWKDRLIGMYAYEDLKLNVGLDEESKNQINRHLLKVYASHR